MFVLKFIFILNFTGGQAVVVGPGSGLDSGNLQRFLRFNVCLKVHFHFEL